MEITLLHRHYICLVFFIFVFCKLISVSTTAVTFDEYFINGTSLVEFFKMPPITQVRVGIAHSVMLSSDNRIFTSSLSNSFFQSGYQKLDYQTPYSQMEPIEIKLGGDSSSNFAVQMVGATILASYALDASGTVWQFGLSTLQSAMKVSLLSSSLVDLVTSQSAKPALPHPIPWALTGNARVKWIGTVNQVLVCKNIDDEIYIFQGDFNAVQTFLTGESVAIMGEQLLIGSNTIIRFRLFGSALTGTPDTITLNPLIASQIIPQVYAGNIVSMFVKAQTSLYYLLQNGTLFQYNGVTRMAINNYNPNGDLFVTLCHIQRDNTFVVQIIPDYRLAAIVFDNELQDHRYTIVQYIDTGNITLSGPIQQLQCVLAYCAFVYQKVSHIINIHLDGNVKVTALQAVRKPFVGSNIVQVTGMQSLSNEFELLDKDGTVSVINFGLLIDSRSTMISERVVDNVVQITSGLSHSLYLHRNGNLYGRGYNQFGQLLTDNVLTFEVYPLLLPYVSRYSFVKVSTWVFFSMGLTDRHEIMEWGYKRENQNYFSYYITVPSLVSKIPDKVASPNYLYLTQNGSWYVRLNTFVSWDLFTYNTTAKVDKLSFMNVDDLYQYYCFVSACYMVQKTNQTLILFSFLNFDVSYFEIPLTNQESFDPSRISIEAQFDFLNVQNNALQISYLYQNASYVTWSFNIFNPVEYSSISTIIMDVPTNLNLQDIQLKLYIPPGGNLKLVLTAPKCFGLSKFDPNVCNGHGECIGVDTCQCSSSFNGTQCEIYSCFDVLATDSAVCNFKNGTCISVNQCQCNKGYTGFDCSKPICFDINDVRFSCSNQGTCIKPNQCECDKAFSGNQCQFTVCQGVASYDSNVCSGVGSCVQGNCICYSNSTRYGVNCENDLIVPIAVTVPIISSLMILILIVLCVLIIILVLVKCIKHHQKLQQFLVMELQDTNMKEGIPIQFWLQKNQLKIFYKKGVLGSGSQGNVLLGSYCNQDVAIKLVNKYIFGTENDLTDFFREAKLLANYANHVSIVRFVGICDMGETMAMVLEYCSNGSLASVLEKSSASLSFSQKCLILKDIVSAMMHLHSFGILHRDLKCENILLDANLRAKISDLGLSVKQNATENQTKNVGTAAFMAPEVIKGFTHSASMEDSSHTPNTSVTTTSPLLPVATNSSSTPSTQQYSFACDVYSFGIIMWCIWMENIFPYGRNTSDIEIITNVFVNRNYRPKIKTLQGNNDTATEAYIHIMQQCWHYDPLQRPNWDNIMEELDQFTGAET